MQVAAFKEELAKSHEAEMARRMNDLPCNLPGTYVGRIGTAVPPDWQPRDPPTEAERRNIERLYGREQQICQSRHVCAVKSALWPRMNAHKHGLSLVVCNVPQYIYVLLP